MRYVALFLSLIWTRDQAWPPPKTRVRCKYFVWGEIICCLVGFRDILVKKLGGGTIFQLDLDQEPIRGPSLNWCKM